LPIHRSATAYRAGISIKHNALAHAANGPILKFDFTNFFPSISGRDWAIYCEREGLGLDTRDLWISTNSTSFFAQRKPYELGSFSWVVDGKEPAKVTRWGGVVGALRAGCACVDVAKAACVHASSRIQRRLLAL
jgi:hypothetical protein